MANTVVRSAANTTADMDNAALNPDVNAVAGGRKIVHITLVAEGVDINPDNIYDMLDTQFAVVAGEKDLMARGCWIFNIGPA